MFFDISLIPLAVLILVGQLKKAPPRLLNNPSYQKEREQVLKHRRILDVLSLSFALALMIIQWGGPLMTLAYRAVIIWGVPSQLYDLWQKFNVPRGVLFACAIALIVIECWWVFPPPPLPKRVWGGPQTRAPRHNYFIFKMRQTQIRRGSIRQGCRGWAGLPPQTSEYL